MRTATKPIKLGSLIKALDEQVSLFVRLNAADQNGTVRCISCDEKLWWVEAQCCHLKDRDNMATRYYLPNLAAGCESCNVYNHYWHIAAWEKKLTEKELYMLNILSHSLMKFTRPELEEMIEDYKGKVKVIRKLKGL